MPQDTAEPESQCLAANEKREFILKPTRLS